MSEPPPTPVPPTSGTPKPPSRRAGILIVLGVLIIAALLAVGVVALLKAGGATPQLQRAVAFALIALPLVALGLWRQVGPDDPLTAAAALIAVSTVVVAALTYVGSVDKDPSFGCINTNGPLEETVSGETSIVYSGATPASTARKLLVRGCELHGVTWCVGAVHQDAIEKRVFDSRWLVLSGGQGLVPIGRTVGAPLPEDKRDDDCEGGVSPPESVDLVLAGLDKRRGVVALRANVPHVAFVGYAIRRSDERWQRLGWDYEADDDVAVVLPAPNPPARPGDEVEAVACLGYRQPAIRGGSVVSDSARLRYGQGFSTGRPASEQPYASTAGEAACTSSVPLPVVPYKPGAIGAVR
jgi:hypothetical protein